MKKSYQLIVLIVLITLVGALPALLQYGCFLMSADIASQQVPFIIETKRMLFSGYPFWNWNHLIGDNYVGSYSFYTLTSPFVWINCLFPDKWMVYGITFTLFLKMICVGLVTYAYLRKMSISAELSTAGALMYTFSSFAISNLFYYHFMEPMLAFPLLLIAIERYLRRERFAGIGLIMASFLVFFINYYFAPCSMIAALVYVLCRLRDKEIRVGFSRMIYALCLIGVGLLLSSFILLPTIAHFEGNPRESYDLKALFSGAGLALERIRTLFEPKLLEAPNPVFENYVYGFSSNAANVPVVGVLLAGLYALRRRDWITYLVVASLILFATPLNGIFSFFTNPYYSRWAYALTLFLILASVKFVDDKMPLKMRHFWIYTLIACGAVLAAHGFGMHLNNLKVHWPNFSHSATMTILIIHVVFVIQMIVLGFFVKRYSSRMLLVCVVVMSMIYFPTRVFIDSDAYSKYGYRSMLHGVIDKYLLDNNLPYHEGDFEWRTDFIAMYPNVAMMKNRPSVATFNSIQNPKVKSLFQSIGYEIGKNPAKANKNVVSYDALMSVKEIIIYDDSLRLIEPSREACLTNERQGDGYLVYDNKYYIPMGFTYDSYINQSAIDSLLNDEQVDVPLQLLANMAVPDSLITMASTVMNKGEVKMTLSMDSLVSERRKNVCSTFSGDTHGFKATITLPQDNLVFFSVPCDDGFTGYVDGVKSTIYNVNLGLSAIKVGQGSHKIEFRYFPKGLREGLFLTLIGLIFTLLVLLVDIKRR